MKKHIKFNSSIALSFLVVYFLNEGVSKNAEGMQFKFTNAYLKVGEKGKPMRVFLAVIGFSQWYYTQAVAVQTHATKKKFKI